MKKPNKKKWNTGQKLLAAFASFCFFVFCATIAGFILCCMNGCKKDKVSKIHSVTYTLYSSTPKYTFNHTESQASSGTTDTIRTNNYSVTLNVEEGAFSSEQGLHSTIVSPTDSLYIRADFEGKKVSQGFKSTGGLFSVSINLANAK